MGPNMDTAHLPSVKQLTVHLMDKGKGGPVLIQVSLASINLHPLTKTFQYIQIKGALTNQIEVHL